MKNFFSIAVICVITLGALYAQYPDTFEAVSATSYTIDGESDEEFWAEATWYDIDNVWMPYGATMETGDFAGRVKFAWTEERFLVFAEITDNELSDDNEPATNHYWDDDCLEVFLDEDRSGGDHTNNHQAFAYHCAIDGKYVIDLGTGGGAIELNDHVDFMVNPKDKSIYHWEMAIKIFDDTYEEDGDNTPVTLMADKEMGLNVAYCDNDETNERENFIGLVDVTEADHNAAYQNADAFGRLVLLGYSGGPTPIAEKTSSSVKVYPSVIENALKLELANSGPQDIRVSVVGLNGKQFLYSNYSNVSGVIDINVSDLTSGMYIIKIKGEGFSTTQLITKK